MFLNEHTDCNYTVKTTWFCGSEQGRNHFIKTGRQTKRWIDPYLDTSHDSMKGCGGEQVQVIFSCDYVSLPAVPLMMHLCSQTLTVVCCWFSAQQWADHFCSRLSWERASWALNYSKEIRCNRLGASNFTGNKLEFLRTVFGFNFAWMK